MIQAKSILDKLIILTAVDQHTRVWQDYLPLKKKKEPREENSKRSNLG